MVGSARKNQERPQLNTEVGDKMARYVYQSQAKDGMGRAMPNASVIVYLAGTTTPATIYAASVGGTAIVGSKVTCDSTGYFKFFVDDGDYASTQRFKIVVSATTAAGAAYQPQTWDYLVIYPNTIYYNSVSVGNVVGAYASAQFDKTADTTLANIPGLSVSLTTGKYYSFSINLLLNLSSGLCKVALSGTTTMTSIKAFLVAVDGSGNGNGGIFTGLNALNSVPAVLQNLSNYGDVVLSIQGSCKVNAGGTFTCQFAQYSASGTSSVLVGSSMTVIPLS